MPKEINDPVVGTADFDPSVSGVLKFITNYNRWFNQGTWVIKHINIIRLYIYISDSRTNIGVSLSPAKNEVHIHNQQIQDITRKKSWGFNMIHYQTYLFVQPATNGLHWMNWRLRDTNHRLCQNQGKAQVSVHGFIWTHVLEKNDASFT